MAKNRFVISFLIQVLSSVIKHDLGSSITFVFPSRLQEREGNAGER